MAPSHSPHGWCAQLLIYRQDLTRRSLDAVPLPGSAFWSNVLHGPFAVSEAASVCTLALYLGRQGVQVRELGSPDTAGRLRFAAPDLRGPSFSSKFLAGLVYEG